MMQRIGPKYFERKLLCFEIDPDRVRHTMVLEPRTILLKEGKNTFPSLNRTSLKMTVLCFGDQKETDLCTIKIKLAHKSSYFKNIWIQVEKLKKSYCSIHQKHAKLDLTFRLDVATPKIDDGIRKAWSYGFGDFLYNFIAMALQYSKSAINIHLHADLMQLLHFIWWKTYLRVQPNCCKVFFRSFKFQQYFIVMYNTKVC